MIKGLHTHITLTEEKKGQQSYKWRPVSTTAKAYHLGKPYPSHFLYFTGTVDWYILT